MCKLVLIDDSPIDHYIMRSMLHNNRSCTQATYTFDGSLVLEFMEENKADKDRLPDAIFLDLTMPGLSGWEFLERFEKLKDTLHKQVDLHVITSSISEADRERTVKYHSVTSFISKPLSKQAINDICANTLN